MDIEILSDASSDEAEVEHTANAITETMETPPPTLTIGTVLQELPKLKSGKTQTASISVIQCLNGAKNSIHLE